MNPQAILLPLLLVPVAFSIALAVGFTQRRSRVRETRIRLMRQRLIDSNP